MNFNKALKETLWLLATEQRISYRRLQRAFDLDEMGLNDLRHEFILVKGWATDQDGEFLVWAGTTDAMSPTQHSSLVPPLKPLVPVSESTPEALVNSAAIARPQTVDSAPSVELASDAERRPLTVMFCDMADSTALVMPLYIPISVPIR